MCLSVCLYLCACVSLSVCECVSHSPCLLFSASVCVCIYLTLKTVCLFLDEGVSLSMGVPLNLHVSVCLCLCLSVYFCLSLGTTHNISPPGYGWFPIATASAQPVFHKFTIPSPAHFRAQCWYLGALLYFVLTLAHLYPKSLLGCSLNVHSQIVMSTRSKKGILRIIWEVDFVLSVCNRY